MCRYGMSEYRSHWVCFPCRYSTKREHRRGDVSCPRCGGEMLNVGRDFKPPPHRNKRQWKKVELLVRAGYEFHSCGCSGPGYRPATLSEAREWAKPPTEEEVFRHDLSRSKTVHGVRYGGSATVDSLASVGRSSLDSLKRYAPLRGERRARRQGLMR